MSDYVETRLGPGRRVLREVLAFLLAPTPISAFAALMIWMGAEGEGARTASTLVGFGISHVTIAAVWAIWLGAVYLILRWRRLAWTQSWVFFTTLAGMAGVMMLVIAGTREQEELGLAIVLIVIFTAVMGVCAALFGVISGLPWRARRVDTAVVDVFS